MSSRALYGGDGVTKTFLVPFPYIKQPDVRVKVNTRFLSFPFDYIFIDDTHVQLRVVPAPADAVEVIRQTDSATALSQFHDGSVLTEAELNLAVQQLLYLIQEAQDGLEVGINTGLTRVATNTGISDDTDVLANVTDSILNSQLLADLQQRITDIDTNAATIGDQVDRVNTLATTVTDLANIDGTDLHTFITNEQTARIEGDTATNQTLSLMGAASPDGASFVLDMAKVEVAPGESLGTHLTAIQSSVDGNTSTIASNAATNATADAALSDRIDAVSSSVDAATASITSEASTRATADSSLSDRLDVVTSSVADNTSAITNEATARTDADSALSTRVDGVLATANNNAALILSEQTARADGDSANASSIVTLQSAVNGNTSSISTQQNVINGLTSEYMVKTDVNGYVAGFGVYNTGATSDFIILGDHFGIVSPSGGARLEWSNGNIRVYDANNVLRVALGVNI